jgi:hypothetical protein
VVVGRTASRHPVAGSPAPPLIEAAGPVVVGVLLRRAAEAAMAGPNHAGGAWMVEIGSVGMSRPDVVDSRSETLD